MSSFFAPIPENNTALRRGLYEGQLFKLGSNAASLRLVEEVGLLLQEELCRGLPSDAGYREAQLHLDNDAFFERIGRIRRTLYMDPRFHAALRAVIEAGGFDPEQVAFDPLRLRTICHEGHLNPRAAAVYLPHRDTWYGHPDCLIAWWIPLDELEPHETFEFFPDYFERGVPNDSECFDYEAWVARGWSLKIGWQDVDAGLRTHYPAANLEGVELGRRLGFGAHHGENLLFAGAHLHQTLPQATGRTRFSLDFRIADLRDVRAGLGAPRVDNRSKGSSLRDYVGFHE